MIIAVLALSTSCLVLDATPPVDIAITERLGAQLPAELPLRASDGTPTRLGAFYSDRRPILLVTAYYHCPMLCGLVLGAVARTLADLDWSPGEQYRVLTVSFDPSDGPAAARQKQGAALAGLAARGRSVTSEAWPFLTADAATIETLLETLGVRIQRDPTTGQYAHPAAIYVLTPEGRVSRYLYGISYAPRDLKLALLAASDGKTGSAVERVLMRCFAYDPATRRYGVLIARFMQVGGAGILLVTGAGLAVLWRRERGRATPRVGS